MDYRETPPPPDCAHLVKAAWTLDVGGARGEWVGHVATPDGCIELIRRLHGNSWWRGEQPHSFVAGLSTAPAELRLSSDARFVALRLWPWAWNALAGLPAPKLVDRWADLAEAAPLLAMPATIEAALALVTTGLVDSETAALGRMILASRSVAELVDVSGRPHRWWQRWFKRHIGVPPGTYLRLLRFQEALADLNNADGSLADHAAAHGFADQAHMAREFRSMSGTQARLARKTVNGPFVAPTNAG